MAAHPAEIVELGGVTASERDALVTAASWYFKYHGPIIAKLADDPSAMAIARLNDFYDLHAALWKLGIRLALPNGLTPRG
jgi:hypothetical protein